MYERSYDRDTADTAEEVCMTDMCAANRQAAINIDVLAKLTGM